MKNCIYLWLFFFCCFSAQDTFASNVLRVAFSEAPPVKVLNNNGEPTGVDIELMKELAQGLGLHVEYEFVPFKRGLYLLEIGQLDLMTGVLRRKEREEYLHYIEPPYKIYSDKVFYVLKGNEHTIKKHEDLHNLVVGTILGVKYYSEFDDDELIKKQNVADSDLIFKMLLAHRINAIITSEYSGEYRVARLGIGDFVTKADYAYRHEQEVYMVLSKESVHAKNIAQINSLMHKLLEQGVYERIKKDFLIGN
jgi:polar amino acid transport system substrate-binding protein